MLAMLNAPIDHIILTPVNHTVNLDYSNPYQLISGALFCCLGRFFQAGGFFLRGRVFDLRFADPCHQPAFSCRVYGGGTGGIYEIQEEVLGRSRGQTANATRGGRRRRSRGIHTAGVEVRLVADEVSGLGISRLRRKTQDADPYT